MIINDSQEINTLRAKLLGSLLLFTQTFYKLRTGREFRISQPPGRESHYISISRFLTDIFDCKFSRGNINIPPRYGKTELVIHFVAWCIARYPDCNFIYTSYSHDLATRSTQTIREIILLPAYKKLFNVCLADDSQAKDRFSTNNGGTVYAAGTGGTITGYGAGIKGVKDRFSGAFIIDDSIKPSEAGSDVIRAGINEWFHNTASSRLNNGLQTSMIHIGQRVHEDDLSSRFSESIDWNSLPIPSRDDAGNALDPSMHTIEDLNKMESENPYVFWAQMQQKPQPAGGGLFKKDWFVLTNEDPEIVATFITADTAETDKTYNDATVFSFWGVYKIKQAEVQTGILGLHWIDCVQLWCEPKDLKSEFLAFYSECMRYKEHPSIAGIEKKSTGTTLISILSDFRGLEIMDITRDRMSKTDRFIASQSFVGSKRISLPRDGKHTKMCIEHCSKITANNSHRYDDIADTMADAIKMSDMVYYRKADNNQHAQKIVMYKIQEKMQNISLLKKMRYIH